MKKTLVKICVALYRINSGLLRKILRGCINRLEGGQAFSNSLRVVMKKYHGYDIGIGTYGACFNPSQAFCGFGNLKVGKFTSIASGVCMYTRNHPYWKPSTSPLFYNSQFVRGGGVTSDSVAFGKLEIGNDVWIGQYAIINASCKKIGDGAVIGAGAIVTKDVPAYAVVVGNPARVIKYRFSEDIIDKLEASQWWNYDLDEIRKNIESFQSIEAILQFIDAKGQLK